MVRGGKARSRSRRCTIGRSLLAIVAVKSPNKTGYLVAEAMERRAGTKGNADQQSTHRTQIRARVTQALGRVRQADQRFAVKHPR